MAQNNRGPAKKIAASRSESDAALERETENAPKQIEAETPATVTATVDEPVSEDDKKDELKEEARTRGLSDAGTKKELVERIQAHDEKGAHNPEVLYPHDKK